MKKLVLGIALSMILLSGCEVSTEIGGSDTPKKPKTSKEQKYPVSPILERVTLGSYQQHTYATDKGYSLEILKSVTSKEEIRFNNKSVIATEVVTVMKINNKTASKNITTNYSTLPFRLEGSKDSDGNEGIVEEFGNIPKTAKVESSGAFYIKNRYANSTRTIIDEVETAIWKLTKFTKKTADLCINTVVEYKVGNKENLLASECYIINENGDILKSHSSFLAEGKNGLEVIKFISR